MKPALIVSSIDTGAIRTKGRYLASPNPFEGSFCPIGYGNLQNPAPAGANIGIGTVTINRERFFFDTPKECYGHLVLLLR